MVNLINLFAACSIENDSSDESTRPDPFSSDCTWIMRSSRQSLISGFERRVIMSKSTSGWSPSALNKSFESLHSKTDPDFQASFSVNEKYSIC